MPLTLHPKQEEALKLIKEHRVVLLEGGSRSGKTFVICLYMHVRAFLYNNLPQLCVRQFYSDFNDSLFQTFPKIMDVTKSWDYVEVIKHPFSINYKNGSTIRFRGLDLSNKGGQKARGSQYSTIYYNEASEIAYESYSELNSRLNPMEGVDPKILIDYNPPSKLHWGYKIFHEKTNPDVHNERIKNEEDYAKLKINPTDNPYIGKDYIEKTLAEMRESDRRRFLKGEYGDIEGALWKSEWIKVAPDIKAEDMISITIGVDPAGTVSGDAVGIVVCGTNLEKYYILEDATEEGRTVYEWANKVSKLYDKYFNICGDITVVAEKNYGGDMVEATLLNENPNMNIKMVNATRGKALRAEPIASLYEKGIVIHTGQFLNLINELLSWTPVGKSLSPNRMDALVWGVTELQKQYGNVIAYSNP